MKDLPPGRNFELGAWRLGHEDVDKHVIGLSSISLEFVA